MKSNTRITALQKRHLYRMSVIIILLTLLCASLIFSISRGAVKVSVRDITAAVFLNEGGTIHQIIRNIRVPRTLVAAMVGLCLALSGAVLQGVMKNPLASPTIIGVSSGAGIAVWIILILLPRYYMLIIPAAFTGAVLSTLLIYFLAWKRGINPTRLILAGVAVSAFLGAMINTLMILYPDRVQLVIGFMVGGLATRTWKHFYMIWPYALSGFILVILFSRRLNILMLGDEVAGGLGLNIEQTRLLFIMISSLLAGSAVSVAGLLGFVGLIVPHIVRIIIGTDYRYVLVASALFGACLLTFCDTLARILFDPIEIPVGIITAVLGAPFFLYLLRRRIKK